MPGYGYRRKPTRRMNLLDWVMLIVTLVFGAVLLLSYFAKYVNPNDLWPFAFFGLAAPVLLIANVVLALYWIVRWKAVVFIPLAVLIVGWGNISSFFRPAFSKHYAETADAADIRLMSYNVIGFLDRENPHNVTRMPEIIAFIRRQNPDILCMQEFQSTPRAPKTAIDTLLSELPYKTVNYQLPFGGVHGWGLAVYSRFRILRSGFVNFENSTNSSLWADIFVPPADTVRVFNNHLQTTQISASDQQFITTPEFMQSGAGEKKQRVKNMARKLRNNYRIRAMQADTLAPMIHGSPYPVIVCGDFNDTPMSYVYHTVRGNLSDAFNEKATGPGNTYQGFFNLFRIDYVFHSGLFRTISYACPSSDLSDHNPVVVELQIKREP